MKNVAFLAILALLPLLAACSINPHPMDMSHAVQNAKTRGDHESLAKHYEDMAKEMRAQAEEHKKLVGQYEAKKDLYGKQAQSMISHCQGLVRIYDQAAAENISMAEAHRQMAAQAK
jgi:peptidoglycan hydrolase CwlO-like protein